MVRNNAQKEKLAARSKALWSDPEYRKRLQDIHRKRAAAPGMRESIAAKIKALWADPEYRANMIARRKQAWQRPGFAERMGVKRKEMWNAPGHREKMSAIHAAYAANPEVRVRLSAQAKRHASSPGAREFLAEKARECWQDDRYASRVRAAMRAVKSKPESRAMASAAGKAWFAAHPEAAAAAGERTRAYFSNPENRKRLSRERKGWYQDAEIVVEATNILNGLGYYTTDAMWLDEEFRKWFMSKWRAKAFKSAFKPLLGRRAARLRVRYVDDAMDAIPYALFKTETWHYPSTGLGKKGNGIQSKLEMAFQREIEAAFGVETAHDHAVGDICLPGKKLAVEVDGSVYHAAARHHNSATKPKTRDYHRNKLGQARKNGWRMIRLWDHEILQRKDQCLNLIGGALDTGRQIRADKTAVEQAGRDTAARLVNQWHIQPLGLATHEAALILRWTKGRDATNEPVAVMTFGRHHRQNGGDNVIVLTRLAFAPGIKVQKGTSRLLAHARKLFPGKKCVSWSHERLSDGGVYLRNGFARAEELPPDYHYVCRDGRVESKQANQKKRLYKQLDAAGIAYDKKETEDALAGKLNKSRVYDCGKIRWELQL